MDRLKIRPRNYTDLIEITKDIKCEIDYYITYQERLKIEAVQDEIRRKAEMEIQKMRGFSGDRNEQSRIGGGNQ